jgi:hypothetical protein
MLVRILEWPIFLLYFGQGCQISVAFVFFCCAFPLDAPRETVKTEISIRSVPK